MRKYRGNLVASRDVQGSGVSKPPSNPSRLEGKGHVNDDATSGGEITIRDDSVRSIADHTKTPPSSKSTKVMSSLPGKVMVGKFKKKGMKMTAGQAAACIGMKKRG